jgi:hypothetical protein
LLKGLLAATDIMASEPQIIAALQLDCVCSHSRRTFLNAFMGQAPVNAEAT